MGWQTVYHTDGLSTKDFLDREFTHENDNVAVSIIASRMVGSQYYAAVQRVIKASGRAEIIAVVVLTSKRHGELTFKDMDEAMGPCYYNCPPSILNRLTPIEQFTDLCDSERKYMTDWRNKCRDNATRRNNKPNVGDTIVFSHPIRFTDGHECNSFVVKKFPSMSGKRNSTVYVSVGNGRMYRISRIGNKNFTVKKG